MLRFSKNLFQRNIRKWHRYLGLFLGLQFLAWTAGGLYFSWSDMDEIHGDHSKAHVHPLSSDLKLKSPQLGIDNLKKLDSVNYIIDIRLVQILNKPVYQVHYSAFHDKGKRVRLIDAETGFLRPALSESEAKIIAKRAFSGDASIQKIQFIDSVNNHHEYRENPLPAYAIDFNDSGHTTVYVSKDLGTVTKFRNQKWRIFDFLWMMHTMDYQSRDNISNILLRVFSILGIFTICSGLILFLLTKK
jgi:hypothetical protein